MAAAVAQVGYPPTQPPTDVSACRCQSCAKDDIIYCTNPSAPDCGFLRARRHDTLDTRQRDNDATSVLFRHIHQTSRSATARVVPLRHDAAPTTHLPLPTCVFVCKRCAASSSSALTNTATHTHTRRHTCDTDAPVHDVVSG